MNHINKKPTAENAVIWSQKLGVYIVTCNIGFQLYNDKPIFKKGDVVFMRSHWNRDFVHLSSCNPKDNNKETVISRQEFFMSTRRFIRGRKELKKMR